MPGGATPHQVRLAVIEAVDDAERAAADEQADRLGEGAGDFACRCFVEHFLADLVDQEVGEKSVGLARRIGLAVLGVSNPVNSNNRALNSFEPAVHLSFIIGPPP